MPNDVAKKRIEEQWKTYRVILPEDASAAQIIETRRAFYAGAQALYHTVLTSLEPGQDATEADLSMMENIDRELRDFCDLVKNGVA